MVSILKQPGHSPSDDHLREIGRNWSIGLGGVEVIQESSLTRTVSNKIGKKVIGLSDSPLPILVKLAASVGEIHVF